MKGLPLAYQKDMQEDKEGAIDAIGALSLSIAVMTGMVRDMSPMSRAMRQAAGEGYSTATDLADWLVRTLKLPFRDAHHVTGRIVAAAAEAGVPLDKLPLEAMQEVEPRITKAVFGVLSVDNSVKSRTAYGGTAPKNVRAQAKRWLKRLKKRRKRAWQRLWQNLADTMSPPRSGVLRVASAGASGERLLGRFRLSVWSVALAAAVVAAPWRLPPAGARAARIAAGPGDRQPFAAAPHAPLVCGYDPARRRAAQADRRREKRLRCPGQSGGRRRAQKKSFILDPLLQ